MGNKARHGISVVSIFCALALLNSCGGGGGGGGETSGAPTSGVQTGTASGTVIDGPISGATVDIFDFTGNVKGLKLGTGTTDANGNYSITLTPRPSGPVMVIASGGSYIEDATGTQTTLGASDQFMEIVPATSIVSGTLTAHVNPLSHIAANLVQAASGSLSLDNAITAAKGVLGQQYGVSIKDLASNVPVSASSPSITTPPSMNQRQSGVVIAGLSQLANTMGVRTVDLIKAFGDDYSDGKFDGKKGAVSITVPKINGGTVALTGTTALADLQAAMTTFLASNRNQSGLTTPPPVNTQPLQAVNLNLNTAGLVFVKTDVLPAFTTGVTASVQLEAAGGTPPYNWGPVTGCPGVTTLPTGLLTATGAPLNGGSIAFSTPCQVIVTDVRGQQATFNFRITTVRAAPSISAIAAEMTTGVQATVPIATASGGTPPYFFYKATGALTPLLTAVVNSPDNTTGMLQGKASSAGVYTFDVCVADLSRTEKCGPVTVVVKDPPTSKITWTIAGSGSVTASGVNTSTNAAVTGISCGTNCMTFPFNTRVTLTATAANGSTFANWSGAGCTGVTATNCIVTLNTDASVTATFKQNPVTGGTFPGKWVGTWSRPSFGFCDNTFFNLTLNLTQSGSSLGGNYTAVVTGVSGFCPDPVGTVKSDTVAFGSVSGNTFTVTMSGGTNFSGTINGTALTGTGGTSSGRGPFNLTKQ